MCPLTCIIGPIASSDKQTSVPECNLGPWVRYGLYVYYLQRILNLVLSVWIDQLSEVALVVWGADFWNSRVAGSRYAIMDEQRKSYCG